MERDYFKIRVSRSVRVALPLSYIDAALQIDRQLVCPIPGVPPGLLGVINRRGTLTWLLDLSHFLELGSVNTLPGQDLKAISIARTPLGGDGAKVDRTDRRHTVACVVSDLEGVFSPRRGTAISQKLKPRLQPLLTQIVYDGNTGIAVLDPEALLRALQDETRPVVST
ncbi:MAG: chemotaxis protein CheW [Cyanobacteria bacterium SID2]|nr:chemotaxis protein CheW [Cyanobacteria bacterium SID2]MBP0004705.1 chemotaxis protein CheW [Cyanobacteria bacterium SBC]